MTVKRFTLAYADYDWWAICDKENPTELGISGEDVVELLNELHEENQVLKKHIRELYRIVKIDVDNEIEVYPKVLLEYIVNILKIIGDVE